MDLTQRWSSERQRRKLRRWRWL